MSRSMVILLALAMGLSVPAFSAGLDVYVIDASAPVVTPPVRQSRLRCPAPD